MQESRFESVPVDAVESAEETGIMCCFVWLEMERELFCVDGTETGAWVLSFPVMRSGAGDSSGVGAKDDSPDEIIGAERRCCAASSAASAMEIAEAFFLGKPDLKENF